MTKPPSSFSYWKLALILVIIAVAIFGYRKFFLENSPETGLYRTEAVLRSDLSSSISATGTLGATATVEVGTQVSGTLQSVEVDFKHTKKKRNS